MAMAISSRLFTRFTSDLPSYMNFATDRRNSACGGLSAGQIALGLFGLVAPHAHVLARSIESLRHGKDFHFGRPGRLVTRSSVCGHF